MTGVVAAPSVHFDSNASAGRGIESLFVDLGASSRAEVTAAGVNMLDAVTLDKQCVALGAGSESHRAVDFQPRRRRRIAAAGRPARAQTAARAVTLAFVAAGSITTTWAAASSHIESPPTA